MPIIPNALRVFALALANSQLISFIVDSRSDRISEFFLFAIAKNGSAAKRGLM